MDISLMATTAHIHPAWVVVCAVVAVVLLLLAKADLVVTLFHEAGHAAGALVTGGRVDGINMHADGEGHTRTLHRGDGRATGLVAVLAGYPAPGVFGLLVAWAYATGHVGLAVAGLAVVAGGVAAASQNLFGFAVAAVLAGLGVWAFLDGHAFAQSVLVLLLAWLLLLGGTLDAGHVLLTGSTDYELLRGMTGIPMTLWALLALAANAWCLWTGGRLLFA